MGPFLFPKMISLRDAIVKGPVGSEKMGIEFASLAAALADTRAAD